MTGSRLPAPPGFLDAIIALAERIDRRRLGLHPIGPGSLVCVRLDRHRGPAVRLADGTVVADGDVVGWIHLDNAAVRRVAADSWEVEGLGAARRDLAELSARARDAPASARPVAYTGATILWPLARRVGFEVRDRRPSFRVRLEDWYLRGVLAHWSRAGRARLGKGRGVLRTREVWLSAAALQRRYGEPARGAASDLPGGEPAAAAGARGAAAAEPAHRR